MTHASVPEKERSVLGISDTLIRLSVGLEDEADIIEDLGQALDAAVSNIHNTLLYLCAKHCHLGLWSWNSALTLNLNSAIQRISQKKRFVFNAQPSVYGKTSHFTLKDLK